MKRQHHPGLLQGVRLFAILCLAGVLHGQVNQNKALSLDQCISLALEKHPLIQASTQRHQAAVARIRQETAIPTPSIDFNSDMQPHFGDFYNSEEAYLGVSHTFELPRKRKARGRIAEQESREVGTDIDLIKLEIVYYVRQSFYELLLAQEKLAYSKQDLELASDYQQKAELKLAAGDVGRVEVLRARVETLRTANSVNAAMNEVKLAKARLNYHLARGKSAPIQITGRLQTPFIELNLDDLQAEALRLRPELQRLEFSIEREDLVQKNASLSSLPDLDFNMSRHRLVGRTLNLVFYGFRAADLSIPATPESGDYRITSQCTSPAARIRAALQYGLRGSGGGSHWRADGSGEDSSIPR